jgi:hypothetical protein
VHQKDGDWRPSSFGVAEAIRLYAAARERHSAGDQKTFYFLVKVHALNETYLGHETEKGFGSSTWSSRLPRRIAGLRESQPPRFLPVSSRLRTSTTVTQGDAQRANRHGNNRVGCSPMTEDQFATRTPDAFLTTPG